MAWEKFTGRQMYAGVHLSIRRSGEIGISRAAVEKFGLCLGKYVVFYFDAEAMKIALEITDHKDQPGATKLKSGGSYSMVVNANSFLKYYDLKPAKARKYGLDKDQESGWLVAEIKTGSKK